MCHSFLSTFLLNVDQEEATQISFSHSMTWKSERVASTQKNICTQSSTQNTKQQFITLQLCIAWVKRYLKMVINFQSNCMQLCTTILLKLRRNCTGRINHLNPNTLTACLHTKKLSTIHQLTVRGDCMQGHDKRTYSFGYFNPNMLTTSKQKNCVLPWAHELKTDYIPSTNFAWA